MRRIFTIMVVVMGMFMLLQSQICSATTKFASDYVEYNGARALAMGGVSIVIADGNTAHLSNPAALVLISRSLVTGGINMDAVSEEGFEGDEQVLDNDQTYFNPLRSQGFVIKNKEVFTGAVSRGMLCDYFTKEEEVKYESKGGLYTFSGSIAKRIIPKLAIGGALNIIRGDHKVESSIFRTERTESGINISLGVLYTPTEQIRIGGIYKTSAEITEKVKITSIKNGKITGTESKKGKWTYPSSMGIGVAYKGEKILLVGELHRTNWSEYKYKWGGAGETLTRPEYINQTTIHMGLEYEASIPSLSPEPLLLRCGFYTSPFHFLEELSTNETTGYFITAGVGINVGDVRIDIAGQLGKKTFTEPEDKRDYEASIKSVLVTVNYQFDLF